MVHKNMVVTVQHKDLLIVAILVHISSKYFEDHDEIRRINKCIFRKESSSQGFVATGAEAAAGARQTGWTRSPAVMGDHTEESNPYANSHYALPHFAVGHEAYENLMAIFAGATMK